MKPNYKAALDLRKLGEERGSLLQRLTGGDGVFAAMTNEIGPGRPSRTHSYSHIGTSLPPKTHSHTDRELERERERAGHGKLFEPFPGAAAKHDYCQVRSVTVPPDCGLQTGQVSGG